LNVVDVEPFALNKQINNWLPAGQPDDTIPLGLLGDGLREAGPSRLLDPIIEGLKRDNKVNHTIRPDVEGDEFAIPDQRDEGCHRR